MSAIEIPNALNFMVSFTAADPPVIIDRSANVEDVEYSAVGTYIVRLKNKIPTGGIVAPGSNLQCSSASASAATFACAIELSGDVAVFNRSLAGSLADNAARIDLACFNYPTVD